MKYRLLISAAAALALSACGDGADTAETDATATDTAMAGDTAMPAPTAESAAEMTAQGFADKQAASDMFEIESGKLAQSMGKSQEVKDFGAMLVKDHTKSTADLKAAAGQANGVTVAPKLDAMQQSNLDALKNAGDQFDTTFKQQQVQAHEMALANLQGYAQNGDSEPLKQFASKTAPVVESHLAKARTLK